MIKDHEKFTNRLWDKILDMIYQPLICGVIIYKTYHNAHVTFLGGFEPVIADGRSSYLR
jgi:hypothetical protein